jgi:F0F1-type ATP synthase membrane subunit b/b'
MNITEHVKGNQDLKKLQADLKAMQRQKHERQEEVEPLQEQATEMINNWRRRRRALSRHTHRA